MDIQQQILDGIREIGRVTLGAFLDVLGYVPQVFDGISTIGASLSNAMNLSNYSESFSLILFGIVFLLIYILARGVRGRPKDIMLLILVISLLSILVYLFLK